MPSVTAPSPRWPGDAALAGSGAALARAVLRLGRGQGLVYAGSRHLALEVPLAAAAARQLLPSGLRLGASTALLVVAEHGAPSFTRPYREATLALPVRSRLARRGLFFAWMVVDDDAALLLGREALGCPKKMATIELAFTGDGARARVERRGATVVEAEAALAPAAEVPGFYDRWTYTLGGLGQGLLVGPVWRYRARCDTRELGGGRARVTLGDVEGSPLATLAGGTRHEGVAASSFVADVAGTMAMLPVALAGPGTFARHYALRYL
jgi:acetoacetate decarboxylase